MAERQEQKNKKNTRYIPDPFEAAALKQLNKNWRFYADKEEFDATVAELKEKTLEVSGQTVTAYDAARANTVINLGAQLYDYNPESIAAAEAALKADEAVWSKIQAIHLYNSAGFRPEIDNPHDIDDSQTVYAMIEKRLDTLKTGEFSDGQYSPSQAEKNILRTLGNYRSFVHNPKAPEEIEQYIGRIKQSFKKIMKRSDYRRENPRTKKIERNKKMSDENTPFILTDEQRRRSEELGIGTDFDSLDAYEEAVRQATERETSAEPNASENTPQAEPDENVNEETSNQPLVITVQEPEQEPNENAQEIPDWVRRKAEFYAGLAQQRLIQDYEQDTSKAGFAAKLEGAQIHYSSPDNVSVSPEAGFKVFDTMFKEPDNKGRPVEFPDNASKEIATRMFAACVLNGNPMQGAVPAELDERALAECGLSAEDLAKVQEAMAQRQPQQQNNERPTQEQSSSQQQDDRAASMQQLQSDLDTAAKLGIAPKEFGLASQDAPMAIMKPNPEITPLKGQAKEDFLNNIAPDDLKRIYRKFSYTPAISEEQKVAREEIQARIVQNDVKQLQEIRNKFNKMKEDGLIAIEKDEQGKPKIVAGENGNETNVQAAESIMKEAATLVKEGLSANAGSYKETTFTRSDGQQATISTGKLDTAAKQQNNTTYREQQVALMRSVFNKNRER